MMYMQTFNPQVYKNEFLAFSSKKLTSDDLIFMFLYSWFCVLCKFECFIYNALYILPFRPLFKGIT